MESEFQNLFDHFAMYYGLILIIPPMMLVLFGFLTADSLRIALGIFTGLFLSVGNLFIQELNISSEETSEIVAEQNNRTGLFNPIDIFKYKTEKDDSKETTVKEQTIIHHGELNINNHNNLNLTIIQPQNQEKFNHCKQTEGVWSCW